MENTSGTGSTATVPGEIDKWNWGAFLLNWIWGVGNGTYIALLMFVPFFNIVMMFILGAKGSAWAWRNRKWDSIAHFKKTQRQWAIWGVIINGFYTVLGTGLFLFILAEIKNDNVYKLAVQAVEQDQQLTTLIGHPISIGAPWDLERTEDDEVVSFSFEVEGPIDEGTIWVTEKKGQDGWKILRMFLVKEDDDEPEMFDLINEPIDGPEVSDDVWRAWEQSQT
jgi:hypothetical protein